MFLMYYNDLLISYIYQIQPMYVYLCILFLITVNSGAFVYKDYKEYKRYNGDFINCEILKKVPHRYILSRNLHNGQKIVWKQNSQMAEQDLQLLMPDMFFLVRNILYNIRIMCLIIPIEFNTSIRFIMILSLGLNTFLNSLNWLPIKAWEPSLEKRWIHTFSECICAWEYVTKLDWNSNSGHRFLVPSRYQNPFQLNTLSNKEIMLKIKYLHFSSLRIYLRTYV